jgi:HEPN domain-containing protein
MREIVCFHCQQFSEKYFKALLQERGLPVPYTHDLEALLALVLPHQPAFKALRPGLKGLTGHAVDTRYPGRRINKRQTETAWRCAERVRTAARMALGLS